MATEIRVPTLGESITEATVGKWFKKAGDAIKADEPLVELETDKVTLEVNAPASGVLAEIAVPTGETVAVGALLGMVGMSGAASAPKPAAAPAAVAPKDVNGVAPKDANGVAPKAPAPVATSMPPAPSAAKIAAEQGVDLGAVAGSGKRGQVLKGDVLAALASPAPAAPVAAPAAPLPAVARASIPDDAAREERVQIGRASCRERV